MRKLWAFGLTIAFVFAVANSVCAQNLSDELRGESSDKLAQDARQNGDAIRGAVIFNKRGLECGRCHAVGVRDLLGPDLSQIPAETTDEAIVDSILNPSKTIREGYETATVVTLDGRVVTGRLISQSEQRVVLRDDTPNGALLTFNSDDIDEISRGTKSMMPDDLIDELAQRQQFLDVVRYVMQLRETVVEPAWLTNEDRQELPEHLQGLAMIDQLNCLACHQSEQLSIPNREYFAPNLMYVRGRMSPSHIQQFIEDPHGTKPGTRMPSLLHAEDDATRGDTAIALTHFVLSLGEGEFARQAIDAEAAGRGQVLYHSFGCVACHTPFDEQGQAIREDSFAAMGNVELKYNLDGLVSFLEEPHESRPSGRMPDMQVSHWEAIDLASYLLTKRSDSNASLGDESYPIDAKLVEAGRTHFTRLGCVQCHQLEGEQSSIDLPSLTVAGSQRGCLAEQSSASPEFSLTDEQRDAIRLAIASASADLTTEERIGVSMGSLNCFACHDRGAIGGVELTLDEYFGTTDQNLGQQGRIPPTLNGVGAKLQPDWMREVLVSGRTIRPYMLTRMPQHGAHNVDELIEWLQEADEPIETAFAEFEDRKVIRDAGLQLVGSQGLNCVACHTYRYEKSETMPSVDLTEMAQRLEKAWFYEYMLNPQRFSHNTVMPSFWPGGKSVRQDVLEGEPALQIESLWQYLLDGRDARAPRGVVREPLEIVSSDEAVMLRRSYRGVGKRGIGVGFASELNLVFDAEQMRIASIWKGKFAEASGVWRGQGSGQIRPLGTDLISFAPGPEIDHRSEPWQVDESRPPQHQFRGYYLDDQQRPTFMYRFDDVEIEDYAIDAPDSEEGKRVIRRTIKLSSDAKRDDIVFRIATAEPVELVGDQEVKIGNQLRVYVKTSQVVEILEVENGNQVRVPLEVANGQSELVLEYEW